MSTIEMSSNETIKQAVMAGLGISFTSLHTVGLEMEHNRLSVLDVEQTPVTRIWHVVNLTGKNLSLPAEAFRYFVLEQGNELMTKMFPLLTNLMKSYKP